MSNFKGNLDFGIKNIRKRPYRSFCLMLAALIGSYALFVGSVLKGSLNNGMTRMQERMGADLMIVPESSEVKARNILLTGEPEFFYMDISVAQALLDIEGVECATSQFYFTSLSSDCCSTRVQLIAYDPDTDFVIDPWIDERITDEVEKGSVIIGSEVTPLPDGKVKFYGSEYPVAGKLGETATGLDHSVFMTRDTMHEILSDAKEKGYQFINPEDDGAFVSTVLIRVSENADITGIEKEIYGKAEGIKFIETDKLINDLSVKLGSVDRLINVTLTVLLVFSFVTMILFFSVIFRVFALRPAKDEELAEKVVRDDDDHGGDDLRRDLVEVPFAPERLRGIEGRKQSGEGARAEVGDEVVESEGREPSPGENRQLPEGVSFFSVFKHPFPVGKEGEEHGGDPLDRLRRGIEREILSAARFLHRDSEQALSGDQHGEIDRPSDEGGQHAEQKIEQDLPVLPGELADTRHSVPPLI